MNHSKILFGGLLAASSVCTLVVACSTSSTSTSGNDAGNDPTPPGTTPVGNAPYSVCTPLEPGSFTASSSYAVPATTSCTPAGSPTSGAADTHCVGVPPQEVNGSSCSYDDAAAGSDIHVVRAALRPQAADDASTDSGSGSTDSGPTSTPVDSGTSDDAGSASDEAGATPPAGPCGENGPDYGATMYGTEGDDDDCKYHVSYTVSPICENNGTYFVVNASYLTQNGAALTGASTFAEVCLSNTHPAPNVDSRPPSGSQQVVEGPPGTYTVGPVQFDAPGDWTVRFHFNEFCCDVADDSPHGHAAFHVTVP